MGIIVQQLAAETLDLLNDAIGGRGSPRPRSVLGFPNIGADQNRSFGEVPTGLVARGRLEVNGIDTGVKGQSSSGCNVEG